jgi:uncharacterized damage-inducible protein DinB
MADDTFLIGGRAGFTPRIGILVSQLQNARHYLLRASRDLGVAELDAAPGPAKNTIGAILVHLDAAENMFQRILFEGRRFNEEEMPRYNPYFAFEGGGRAHGREVASYHHDLRVTRERTLEGLRQRDDAWLDTPKTFMKQPSNVFYYWFHYIQDEARHTGQIILIRKHLMAGADPDFEPYTP